MKPIEIISSDIKQRKVNIFLPTNFEAYFIIMNKKNLLKKIYFNTKKYFIYLY